MAMNLPLPERDRIPDGVAITVLALISLYPFLIACLQSPMLNDDTFITLTYAKNLAAGNGFVFNGTKPTLGTTSPLLALLMAAISRLLPFAPMDRIAVFFTALCWAALPWAFQVWRREWHLRPWQVCVLGAVMAGTGWPQFLGMEAYLFALLLVLALSRWFAGRSFATGVMLGLLTLTRGEGMLAACLLMAGQAFLVILEREASARRSRMRHALWIGCGFLIPLGGWIAYATATFGSPVPNTLAAKQAQVATGIWTRLTADVFRQWLHNWPAEAGFVPWSWRTLWLIVPALGVGWAACCRRRWLCFLVWSGAYVAAYSFLGVSAYWWYAIPLLFTAQLFLGLGLIAGVAFLWNSRWWVAGIPLALALLIVYAAIPLRTTWRRASSSTGDERGPSYQSLAEWFQRNTTPAESLAFIEIGYLGYFTSNPVIDLAGLILPEAVPYVARKDFAHAFWAFEPDYYVYLPDFDWALAAIRANPEFDRRYSPVAELPGPREAGFVIFKRKKS